MAEVIYSDDEISEVVRQLQDCTLPKDEWTHAAHWAAALAIASAEDEPFAVMAATIPPYNEAVGGQNTDTEGYHDTITYACMALAEMVVGEAEGRSLSDIHAAVMASPLGGMDWLKRHHSPEILWSVAARRKAVEPDLAPLKDALQDVTDNLQG
ncbi:MAG: hypothetical protein AAFR65_04090 [Pseudomonadota bacterium]